MMPRAGLRLAALGVRKQGQTLLDGIDLSIEAGEFFALLGPSGSGKTSLLRVIAGLDKPSSGSLRLDDREITGLAPWQRGIGLVFQGYALWSHLSVAEHIDFALEEHGLSAPQRRERMAWALDAFALADFAGRRPAELSGGQQQRLALARALAGQPRLLLLDEPFSHLDPALRQQMRRELRRLQRQLGFTTVLVTHDQQEALSLADRIGVIRHGRLEQVGTPAALYDFPQSAYVAQIGGAVNLISGQLLIEPTHAPCFVSPDLGKLPLPTLPAAARHGAAGQMALRPQAIRLIPVDSQRNGRDFHVEGVIENVEFTGSEYVYTLQVGEQCLTASQPHLCGMPALPAGQRILLALNLGQARLFLADEAAS